MARQPVNVERDREIVKLRREGAASLQSIAADYGISTERVRQISSAGGVSNADAAIAYARAQEDRKFDAAEGHSVAILMRWIGGEQINDIAKSLGITIGAAQAVLDEQVTDEIQAARSNNQTAQRFPDVAAGPRQDRDARDDRRWTESAVLAALVKVARSNGGRLPSSTKYKVIGSEDDDLPSFPTVRNRLGRWSHVKVLVHNQVKS